MVHQTGDNEVAGALSVTKEPETWSLADLARAAIARRVDASDVLAGLLGGR